MAKESYYFSHDYDPTGDPKMQAMVGNYGGMGYGIFWRIVEMLHADESHKIPLKRYIFEAIAKQMQTNAEQVEILVKECVDVYELFCSDGKMIWSNRVIRNIEKKQKISKVRSESGKKGAIAKQMPANAKQNQAKERKGKESIIPEMIRIFKNYYPEYPEDINSDSPYCLQIAYKIAKQNEWTKESVVNGRLDDTLKIWESMVSYSVKDAWFSTRAISDFDKEYQRLIQKMNAAKPKDKRMVI